MWRITPQLPRVAALAGFVWLVTVDRPVWGCVALVFAWWMLRPTS